MYGYQPPPWGYPQYPPQQTPVVYGGSPGVFHLPPVDELDKAIRNAKKLKKLMAKEEEEKKKKSNHHHHPHSSSMLKKQYTFLETVAVAMILQLFFGFAQFLIMSKLLRSF